MGEDLSNVGHALLIVGSIYLHYQYGLNQWVVLLLSIFALASWVHAGFSDERKDLYTAMIKFYEAKAGYFMRKSERPDDD